MSFLIMPYRAQGGVRVSLEDLVQFIKENLSEIQQPYYLKVQKFKLAEMVKKEYLES